MATKKIKNLTLKEMQKICSKNKREHGCCQCCPLTAISANGVTTFGIIKLCDFIYFKYRYKEELNKEVEVEDVKKEN